MQLPSVKKCDYNGDWIVTIPRGSKGGFACRFTPEFIEDVSVDWAIAFNVLMNHLGRNDRITWDNRPR